MVMPSRIPRKWCEDEISAEVEAKMTNVLEQLWSLEPDVNEDGEPYPIDLSLTPAGKRVWIAFHDAHGEEQAGLSGPLAAAWSKIEGYTARLALIVHLVRWAARDPSLANPHAIDEESVKAAVILTGWFKYEVERIYEILEETVEERDRRHLMELIERKSGTITAASRSRAPASRDGQGWSD